MRQTQIEHYTQDIEPRFERKALLNGPSLASVIDYIQMSPAFFRPAYPSRRIQNLYLDSPTYEAWRRHIEGSALRSKFRIRWYGEKRLTESPLILEQKIKWGQTGTKTKTELGMIGRQLISSHGDRLNPSILPPDSREQCQGLIPSLYNRYKRQYFISFDRSVRLTVDSQIAFARPNHLSSPVHLREHLVIEYKYLLSREAQAQKHLSFFPWRLSKHSKYITGMNLLY